MGRDRDRVFIILHAIRVLAAASMTDRDGHIAVVGPIPPPTTRRTFVTERILEELARSNYRTRS